MTDGPILFQKCKSYCRGRQYSYFLPIERLKSEILLTLWRTVLVRKLTDIQLIEKFHLFYGNRRFISPFTGMLH
jgi:hypothetical protein